MGVSGSLICLLTIWVLQGMLPDTESVIFWVVNDGQI